MISVEEKTTQFQAEETHLVLLWCSGHVNFPICTTRLEGHIEAEDHLLCTRFFFVKTDLTAQQVHVVRPTLPSALFLL